MPDPYPGWREQSLPFHTTEVRLNVTVVLNGPQGTAHVGHDVRDLVRREPLVIGATPFTGERFTQEHLVAFFAEVLAEAFQCLDPF